MKEAVPLARARDTALFGSKAVALGDAIREGIPVPPGVALSGSVVDAAAAGDERVIKGVTKLVGALEGPLAVRSSATCEDGELVSMAGLADSKLGVRGGQRATLVFPATVNHLRQHDGEVRALHFAVAARCTENRRKSDAVKARSDELIERAAQFQIGRRYRYSR